MQQYTDEQLVGFIRNQKDSEEAFSALVSRYTNKAFGLCLRFTRNRADAEEALQETFINVYRKLDNFEGNSSFASWLFRVTVNTSLMKLRKRRQFSRVQLMNEMNSEQVTKLFEVEDKANRTPDEQQALLRLKESLYKAIESLPKEFRDVFVLKDVDGLSSHAVAKVLGISEPAVKSRLHRSRLLMRKKMLPLYKEYFPFCQAPIESSK
jgi:RNA polymerase sigma-70 factor (ECF subfamily)